MTETTTTVTTPAPPAAPTNAAEASARLATLQNDPAWAKRLLANDAAARADLGQLSKLISGDAGDEPAIKVAPTGDQIDAVMAGASDGLSSTNEMVKAVPWLREVGLPDDTIRQVLTDQEISQQEYDLAASWKSRHMRDSEWCKKYLAGDVDAARQMMSANILLNSKIKGN